MFEEIAIPEAPIVDRNEKGQIVTGVAQETNKNGTAGRPCMFCENKEEYLEKTKAYLERVRPSGSVKAIVPWIEELALELDTTDENIVNWAKKKTPDSELEHPEFFTAVAKLKMIQKLRLQQRTLGRYQPMGALKLLQFNHGAVETSKQILAGDQNEPLEIIITEQK